MSLRHNTAYGLDISESHLVVVRARGGHFETIASSSGSAPQLPNLMLSQISSDIASGKAVTSASVNCYEAILRRLTSPFTRLDRAVKILPSLLDVQLPFPLDECAHVFTSAAPDAGGGLGVLAIAARKEDVQERIARIVSLCGVEPMILDHEGLALWRTATDEIGEAGPAGRVIVHLCASHTTVVYGRGENLLGAHSARTSAATTQDASVIARVQSWLNAQTSLATSSATEWIFTGSGAADGKRIASFQTQLALAAPRVVSDPAAFLARGLAARALKEDAHACNLRTGSLQHEQSARASTATVNRTHATALIAAVALVVLNVGALMYSAQRNENIRAEIQQLAMFIADAPAPKGQETLVVRRALDERAAKLAPFQKMVSSGTSKRVGDILSLCGTNGASASKLTLQSDSLHLEMTAAHAAGAEAIERALRSNGWQLQTQKRGQLLLLEGTR